MWMLVAASVRLGRPEIGERAVALAEKRLSQDEWPEYYDGRNGRLVGKASRKYQTWTIAALILSKMMLENPDHLKLISFDEDPNLSQWG